MKINTRHIFFILTIFTGIIALWPYQNFQYWIAQGDHGRDLYCFKRTLDGALPYRDYSWLFGPLMPYYYGLFFEIFGLTIPSVLLGQNLLLLAAGTLVFLMSSLFFSPAIAYVAAVWYWAFRGMDFFYTYNHTGGIVAILASLYCGLLYVKNPLRKYVLLGFVSLLALLLIRVNVGVATLVAFTMGILLADGIQKNPAAKKNRLLYLGYALGTLLVAAAIYLLFLYRLPDYIVRQSFPFQKDMRTDLTPSFWVALKMLGQYIYTFSTASLARILLGGLVMLTAAQTLLSLGSKKTLPLERQTRISVLIFLGLYFAVNMHEYLASGVHYRLNWAFPIMVILCLGFIHWGVSALSSKIKLLIILILVFLGASSIIRDDLVLSGAKKNMNSLQINGKTVYTYQDMGWFKTVSDASQFIQAHVPPGEKIFALPFDPLYYFLTGHDSATRQLVFFDHIKITPEQERQTIADLERHQVNYVILSNRSRMSDEQLGVLGQTYCPLLYQYLIKHFESAATFGPWDKAAGWAWNHAVKVLKRKTP